MVDTVEMAEAQEKSMLERRFAGLVAARGLFSADVQAAIPKLAQKDLGAVTRVVAKALLVSGAAGVVMPPAVGRKTDDLMAAVRHAAGDVARAYHQQGGALTAKEFRTPETLADVLFYFWVESFAPPIPVTKTLVAGLPPDECIARMSVAAQAANAVFELLFTEATKREEAKGKTAAALGLPIAFLFPDEDARERACIQMTKAVIRAFDDPDRHIHERTHGPLD